MGRVGRRFRAGLIGCVFSTCLTVVAPTPACAQRASTITIPAQTASNAITQLARQTGTQILFDHAKLKHVRSNAVSGASNPQEALRTMLRGTRFEVGETASGALVVTAGIRGSMREDAARPAPPVAYAQAPADPGAETGATDARAFEADIVVTAQKRSENLQDVSASISVIDGQQLERLGATQLTDYAAYIPGLAVESEGAPGLNSISLRGISTGTNVSSTVGIYVDDVPVGSSSAYAQGGRLALDLMPYDIVRVEVLRGPQGTLYGASTLGGLLKYVTRQPGLDDFEIRAGGELSGTRGAGDPNWGARAAANLPVVAGNLAIRASGFYQRTAGYIDNVVTGERNENETRQYGGRVSLLWQATPDFSAKLTATHQIADSEGTATVTLQGVGDPLYGDLKRGHAIPEGFKSKLSLFTGELSWDFGSGNLLSVTSYERSDATQHADQTSQLDPLLVDVIGPHLYPAVLDLELKKFTQELRIVSPNGGSVEWLAGLFYTHEQSANAQAINVLNPDRTAAVGLDPAASILLPSEYSEFAAFGNLTFHLSDRFDITAGGRYSHNRQSFEQINIGGSILNVPPVEPQTASDDVFTFLLSPRLHLADDTMLYGRIASGYRPGGPNVALATFNVGSSYKPDNLVNYEIGLKSELFDRRLLLDVAAFYIDWSDIQLVTQGGAGSTALVNGGKASSQGIEMTSAFKATPELRLGFNAAYTHAQLEEDLPAFPGIEGTKGSQLPGTSKWSMSATANYNVALNNDWDGHFGIGYRYVGKRFGSFASGPRVRLRSYYAVDLNAGVATRDVDINLFVRNLTDKRGYSNPLAIPTPLATVDAQVTTPRTIGIRVDTSF